MKTVQTRFGQIRYDPGQTIYFPQGLIGFEYLRRFILVPGQEDDVVFCIQSLENENVAFLLTDPLNFFPDYQVCPDTAEKRLLGIGEKDEYFVYSTITVHPDRRITINLQAPVFYTPKTGRAVQGILEDATYGPRTPLTDKNNSSNQSSHSG